MTVRGGTTVRRLNLELSAVGRALSAVGTLGETDLFRAAVTGLGAPGVVSAVTMRTTAAFQLRVMRRGLPLAEFLGTFDELARSGRHVAFSWLPWSDNVGVQTMTLTDLRPARTGGPGSR